MAQRHPDHASSSQRHPTPPITTPERRHTPTKPPITTAQRHPDHALPTNHHGTATPTPSPPRQSQRHSATQTTLSPPITMAQRHPFPRITTARRHPDQALPSNHNGTAPPRPSSPHSPAITTAQRHPDQALPSNHSGTAPPRPGSPQQSQRHTRPGSPQQSQRHSATHTTLSPRITMAQRHPHHALPPITTAQRHSDHTLFTNHHGTAPPRPRSPHQSLWHNNTHTTLPADSPDTGQSPRVDTLPGAQGPKQAQAHLAGIWMQRPHSSQGMPSNGRGRQAGHCMHHAPKSRRAAMGRNKSSRGSVVRYRSQNRNEHGPARPQTPQITARTLHHAFGKKRLDWITPK